MADKVGNIKAYSEALNQFLEKINRETNEIYKKCDNTKSYEERVNLRWQLKLFHRRHNEEFRKLRAKYHLPPPKIWEPPEL